MIKPMMRIHNTETNEIIDRELTNEELIQYNLEIENMERLKTEVNEKVIAKQSALTKLQALGLTEAEVKALIGI